MFIVNNCQFYIIRSDRNGKLINEENHETNHLIYKLFGLKNLIKYSFSAICVAVLAALCGSVTALLQTARLNGGASVDIISEWYYIHDTGSADATPQTRARFARTAILAVVSSEAIYFFSKTDAAGRPLDPKCSYEIVGSMPHALWWSITAYDGDKMFIPNALRRSSIHSQNVVCRAQNYFSIHLSPNEKEENWLPATDARDLEVMIRIYHPSPQFRADPRSAELPRIQRVSC